MTYIQYIKKIGMSHFYTETWLSYYDTYDYDRIDVIIFKSYGNILVEPYRGAIWLGIHLIKYSEYLEYNRNMLINEILE